jgi:TPR repeat protein
MSRISASHSKHGPNAGPNAGRHPLCRLLLLAAALTLAPLVQAQEDYDAGKRAYLSGDYAEALRIWQPLADGGNKFAQFSIGSLYFEGAGVEKNYEESARNFELAAKQGYAPAQFNLGNAYKHGNGIPQDDLKAAEWWEKAAEQDFAPAQFNLGTQYYFGRGVPKDEETAIRWYRRAAENGHVQAQRLFSMTDTPANQVQASSAAPTATEGATVSATDSAPGGQTGSSGGAAPAAAAATTMAAAATAPSASTPAPGQQPGGDTWLMAQKATDYTLQLLATHDEKLMREYLGKYQFTEPVAYFAFQRDGKQWFAAVYGSYAEKSQAQNAIASLPGGASKNPPWIRQFGGIHKLIKSP